MTDNPLDSVLDEAVRTTDAESLPALIGKLEATKARAYARIQPVTLQPVKDSADDELLDVSRAAAMLSISRNYLYRHSALFSPVRVGKRLLFPRRSLLKYIAQNTRK